MGEIRLESVTKQYPGGVTAVDDLTLSAEDGEFLVLVGPSGCGKSTLLRVVAGLEEISHGTVWIGDRNVTNLIPRDRDIAMVFQNYSLYPHLSVRDNLAYGLKVRRTPRTEIRRRIAEVARLLQLEELLDRKPRALSGGQRQRVAMGRAIVREPLAFLMDEPLSNLDAKLRVSMRSSLLQLHARLGVTTIYVTHDQVEAMTLGERVAVLSDGRLQQVDRPQVLYNQPANLFVATFIGSPAMNVVEVRIEGSVAVFGSLRVPLDAERRPSVPDGTTVILGIRPEDLEDAAFAAPTLPTFEVQVEVVEETGADAYVIFPIDAPVVQLGDKVAELDREEGSLILEVRTLVTARVHPGTAARPGEMLRVAADPSRFFFFDRETGDNLVPEAARVPGHANTAHV